MEENPSNVSPNSGSLPDINLHTATGDERLMGVLYRKIEDLAKEVHELKTKKIIDETQMPPELLEQSGMLPPDPTKVERGRGFRPLLRSEIEEAVNMLLMGVAGAMVMILVVWGTLQYIDFMRSH